MLVSGADFYSNPRLSPDGTKLAWVRSGPRAYGLLRAIQSVRLGDYVNALQAWCTDVRAAEVVRLTTMSRKAEAAR